MTPEKKQGGFNPVVTVLLGMAVAIGVFAALYAIDFTAMDLAWSLPALALSALLVFSGAKKLRRK